MKKIDIGIDPGTHTGMAVVEDGILTMVKTLGITQAMKWIRIMRENRYDHITLHIENPNLRKFFGKTGREKLQGAGSIKRDYSIWEEFAKEEGITLVPVPPASIGSQFDNEAVFKAATGWTARTSKHGRDAVKIVIKFIVK